jgi:hypothetical protein
LRKAISGKTLVEGFKVKYSFIEVLKKLASVGDKFDNNSNSSVLEGSSHG